MAYFIRAAEVWLLDSGGRHLELGCAHYGELHEEVAEVFHHTSKNMRFAANEGMPGITWAMRRPLIWTDLSSNHFKRKELVVEAGLVCGLSIPVFAGEFLLGVVLLFCGDREDVTGVVEVWHNRDYYDTELHLLDGYYGKLERFEYISRRLTLMRGRGLPGSAWSSASPIIMQDLAEDSSFLRARNAAECQLKTGLAIPCFYTDRDVQIITFLSTDASPIASRFEIWRPDSTRRYLLFSKGWCAKGSNLYAQYRSDAYDRGESMLGQVWLNGRPLIEQSQQGEGRVWICIPIIIRGDLQAVVRFAY